MSEQRSDVERIDLASGDAPVRSATVFADRAEVTRRAQLSFDGPKSVEVVLRGVSEYADVNTLRVRGTGNFAVVDVTTDRIVGSDGTLGTDDEAAERVRARVAAAKLRVTELQQETARLEGEKEMLLAFAKRALGTTGSGPPLVEGSVAAARTIVADTMAGVQEAEAKANALVQLRAEAVAELQAAENEVGRTASATREVSFSVIVSLDVAAAGECELEVVYVVSHASWTPAYTLRADSGSDDVHVTYMGAVTQSTREDWNECKVELSTARPAVAGTPPSISPVVIRTGRPMSTVGYLNDEDSTMDMLSQSISSSAFNSRAAPRSAPAPRRARASVRATTVQAGVATATFAVPQPVTVPSGPRVKRVTVAQLSMPAIMTHYVVPDESTNAFLKASARNTSSFPLLASAQVSVFLGGDFVAKSSVPEVSPGERFDVFLGTDPTVKVTPHAVKKKTTSSGWLSKARVQTVQQAVEVRNLRERPVTLCIKRALPTAPEGSVSIAIAAPREDELARGAALRKASATESAGAGAGAGADGEAETGTDEDAVAAKIATTPHTWIDRANEHVEWVRILSPADKLLLPFRYTITYPASSSIHTSRS